MKTNTITCKHCRRSMRLWALAFRRHKDLELKKMYADTAILFRDGPCLHEEAAPSSGMCVCCAKDFGDCTCKVHYHRAF